MSDDFFPDSFRPAEDAHTLSDLGFNLNSPDEVIEANVNSLITNLVTGCDAAIKMLTVLTNSSDQSIALDACRTLLEIGYDVMTTEGEATE